MPEPIVLTDPEQIKEMLKVIKGIYSTIHGIIPSIENEDGKMVQVTTPLYLNTAIFFDRAVPFFGFASFQPSGFLTKKAQKLFGASFDNIELSARLDYVDIGWINSNLKSINKIVISDFSMEFFAESGISRLHHTIGLQNPLTQDEAEQSVNSVNKLIEHFDLSNFSVTTTFPTSLLPKKNEKCVITVTRMGEVSVNAKYSLSSESEKKYALIIRSGWLVQDSEFLTIEIGRTVENHHCAIFSCCSDKNVHSKQYFPFNPL